MPTLSQELLAAAAKFETWQQDAFRRIVSGPLIEQDYEELVELAKAESGISVKAGAAASPLAPCHLSQTHAHNVPVTLKALHSAQWVNALAPGQQLDFGPVGLTVVYGENGSGKSGYSRILRKACRARMAPTILPNVLGSGPLAPARAKFVVDMGAGDIAVDWIDGKPSPDALAHFAVFDRDCEHCFIDEHGEAAFIPAALGRFEELVRAVDEVKRRLEAQAASARPTDDLRDIVAKAGASKPLAAVIATITPDRPDADYKETLNALSQVTWNDQCELGLSASQQRLLESGDPIAKAKALRSLGASLKAFRVQAEGLCNALSDATVESLIALRTKARTAANAADEAAQGLDFMQEPATHVGGPEWQLLYNAAVKFAVGNTEAIRNFPLTPPDARCPLCLQPLHDDARDRFARFKRFMTQETKSLADRAEREYMTALDGLRALVIRHVDSHVADQVAQASTHALPAATLNDVATALSSRRSAILEALTSGSSAQLPPLPTSTLASCAAVEVDQKLRLRRPKA